METKTTGYVELRSRGTEVFWIVRDADGETLKAGYFEPVDFSSEDFDFDEATAKVAQASGVALENIEGYTESDRGRIYWEVAFE